MAPITYAEEPSCPSSPLSPFSPLRPLKAKFNEYTDPVEALVTVTCGVPVVLDIVAVAELNIGVTPSCPSSPLSPFSPLRPLKAKFNEYTEPVDALVTVTCGVPVVLDIVAVAELNTGVIPSFPASPCGPLICPTFSHLVPFQT